MAHQPLTGNDLEWDYPQPFMLQRTPQAADIDGLNHTNNAVYVRWCEQAGWAHSEALGLTLEITGAWTARWRSGAANTTTCCPPSRAKP
jgi:acyl-ACP thioesterase